MSVTQLARAKQVLSQFTRPDCQALLAEVSALDRASLIRDRLKQEFDSRDLSQILLPKSMARLDQIPSES